MIDPEELDRLRQADAELYEYRRLCGGRLPDELSKTFDRVIEQQEIIRKLQEEQRNALESIEKRLGIR